MADVTYNQLFPAATHPLNLTMDNGDGLTTTEISFDTTTGTYTTGDAAEQAFLDAAIVERPDLLEIDT